MIAKKPSQRLVDGAIIWKGFSDLRIKNDDICGFKDLLCVFAPSQRAKVRALVLGSQIVGRVTASLLHRSPFHLVSLAVR